MQRKVINMKKITIIGSIAGAAVAVALCAYDIRERKKDNMDINKKLADVALTAIDGDTIIIYKHVNNIDKETLNKLIEDKNVLMCKFMDISNTESYKKSKEVYKLYDEYIVFENRLIEIIKNINKKD